MSRTFASLAATMITSVLLAGCASQPAAYDYTAFNEHPPRSILVLPPMNESLSVRATYGYLSTVTMPLAEHGYYVFPVQIVDEMLKENGLPTPGEMHEIPLDRARDIFGADAVMYITVQQYGDRFVLVSSSSDVSARVRLVDTRTGTLIWGGHARATDSSGGSGSLIDQMIVAAIMQGIKSTRDDSHRLSSRANLELFRRSNNGLPYGPYSARPGEMP